MIFCDMTSYYMVRYDTEIDKWRLFNNTYDDVEIFFFLKKKNPLGNLGFLTVGHGTSSLDHDTFIYVSI